MMKTAVITGASAGIGRATALELGRRGFHVVALGRSQRRAEAVVSSITSEGGSAAWGKIDLNSLDDVRRAAKAIENDGHIVDVLINNAGVGMTKGMTQDGFEVNFGVNHLAHFLLTDQLRGTFRPGTRIVNLTSSMHFRVDGIDFDRVTEPSRSFLGLDDYAVSKLANILFTSGMASRDPDRRTYAVHPGFTDTRIIKPWARPFVRHRLIPPDVAARTTILCATDPALDAESGGYYARMESATPSAAAQDSHLADELWARSEGWTGVRTGN